MKRQKKYNKLITILSIILPIAVAAMFKIKLNIELPVFLPPIYATINGFTALILIMAVIAIKNKNKILHERLMKTAMGLSALFLILYVLYHATSNSTHFGGEGAIKYIYYFVLISHIILSVIVIPFVLVTFARALNEDFIQHKKLGKFAFYLWLYVAITGVVVYLMIAPYYL